MLTTTGTLPSPVQVHFDKTLLAIDIPGLIHRVPAMAKKLPSKSGGILRMSRFNKLATAPVPLGNTGITPPGQAVTRVDIDAKPQLYGTWVGVNEQVTLAYLN